MPHSRGGTVSSKILNRKATGRFTSPSPLTLRHVQWVPPVVIALEPSPASSPHLLEHIEIDQIHIGNPECPHLIAPGY